ncbi:MAG: thiamine-phosphate kinase [Sphingosinicella sp.]
MRQWPARRTCQGAATLSAETDFIALLRPLAGDAAARGLRDDAAVLEIGGQFLVITHDTLVEGVHFLADDPPADIAWKLVAVNLSDLAGKGARPRGALLAYALGDEAWDSAFVAGLATALSALALPLLGGDTVKMPAGAPRSLGLTALGITEGPVPGRGGASPGEQLWVSGTIGDAGAGLERLRAGKTEPAGLIERYRTPRPRLETGQRLAPLVSAMMDVSDGLLLDATRLAEASGCRLTIALDRLPLSTDLLAVAGEDRAARLTAATAGDDYELLFTASPAQAVSVLALAEEIGLPLTRIGACSAGRGLALEQDGAAIPLPERLGYEHGRVLDTAG